MRHDSRVLTSKIVKLMFKDFQKYRFAQQLRGVLGNGLWPPYYKNVATSAMEAKFIPQIFFTQSRETDQRKGHEDLFFLFLDVNLFRMEKQYFFWETFFTAKKSFSYKAVRIVPPPRIPVLTLRPHPLKSFPVGNPGCLHDHMRK